MKLWQRLKLNLFNPNRKIETICTKCAYLNFDSYPWECIVFNKTYTDYRTGEKKTNSKSCSAINVYGHCPYYKYDNTMRLRKLMEANNAGSTNSVHGGKATF